MLAVSIILFLALEVSGDSVATKALGRFSTPEQRALWLEENGYNDPVVTRYLRWIGGFVTGDWGYSYRFKVEVTSLIAKRLFNTAVLALISLFLISVISLTLGVWAGLKEGTKTDTTITFLCVFFASVPEFASSVFLAAIFVYYLDLLPGVSSLHFGFSVPEMILPTLVLTLYGFGYLSRITRAAVCEIRSSGYVRTAYLKGLPFRKVIFSYVLRNSLITPVTVIFLQFPWLLSGVIVVEFFFAYKGFGALLLEASLNDDIYLLEACAMISVLVVFFSQLIADIIYAYLNPKIRLN